MPLPPSLSPSDTAPPNSAEVTTRRERAALMGHDLRAAASDIIGGLRLIERDGLPPQMQMQFARVRAASETMARLLEQGLDLVAEDIGVADSVPSDMGQLLHDLEMRWLGRAQEKQLRLDIALSPDLPDVVIVDRTAFERCVSNLISNAIKFTDQGGVRLTVTPQDPAHLLLTVDDDGPGFEDRLLHLPPDQALHHTDRMRQGQGLGLYIAHEMAQRLDGELRLSNRADRGARVALTIPIQSPAASTSPSHSPLPNLHGKRILVVEDSQINQAVLNQMLVMMGAQVELCDNGLSAQTRLRSEHFDAAIVDIELPGLSGLDLIAGIKSYARRAHLPVIACTAYVLRANREAIMTKGADAIVAKPLTRVDALADALRQTMPHLRSTAQCWPEPAMDHSQLEHLLEIAGVDGRSELLDRLSYDLQRVERGLIAALADRDAKRVREQLHVLVAVSGAVGANRLLALSHAMQDNISDATPALHSDTAQSLMAELDKMIHYVGTFKTQRKGQPT
ncbi:response regulator [Thioclava sp. SK-1]|uniref:response regulator n=1 Tax=Thioclava sp. SK-1 TaxID=1889770 RepID=UPI00159EF58D|nr:response regulator [Thioclava sp. SK-1]